jgi:hypothetical protein
MLIADDKWRAFMLMLMLTAMTGCAAIDTPPDALLRVTEYNGSGSISRIQGAMVGCQAVAVGKFKGCFTYKGSACSYVSEGC